MAVEHYNRWMEKKQKTVYQRRETNIHGRVICEVVVSATGRHTLCQGERCSSQGAV